MIERSTAVSFFMLIVSGARNIALAITGFTVAHAITLIATSFGVVAQPSAIVEVLIALSVLILAVEAVHASSGRMTLINKYPFSIVCLFGFLHGLGFVGVLTELGFSDADRLFALLQFNAGVEISQLLFVACCLLSLRITAQFAAAWSASAERFTAYVIGGTAAYWTIGQTIGAFAPVFA